MDQELSRPISYEFWKELHKDSMYKVSRSSPDQFPTEFQTDSFMTRSFPDKFPMDFERNSLMFPHVNWPGALQTIFLKSIGNCLNMTRSSPDQFPIDFEMDSLRIPYVNWQGAFQPNFQWILKRIPYGFHM